MPDFKKHALVGKTRLDAYNSQRTMQGSTWLIGNMERDIWGVPREWDGCWLKHEDLVNKVEFNWNPAEWPILEKVEGIKASCPLRGDERWGLVLGMEGFWNIENWTIKKGLGEKLPGF